MHIVPSLVEIGSLVLETKLKKCEKFTMTTTTMADNGQISTSKSSLEPSVQVTEKKGYQEAELPVYVQIQNIRY